MNENYVIPNKDKYIYVVGIDFGHGETSADMCTIQWDVNCSELESPGSIEIFNGKPAIKSVLLIEKKGKEEHRYIGEQAVSRYANPKYHANDVELAFYSYFKKTPSSMSAEDKNVMRIFMREVYRQIRKQRPELKDDNHLVYIACPSNSQIWTDKEVEQYAQIALEAGLPLAKVDDKNVGIIRESRAAFIKARSGAQYKSSIKEGLLLIDFGSSTVDLTYYSSKYTEEPIDDGDDCGASHVEVNITKDLSHKFAIITEAMAEFPSAKTAILLSVREAKESFYTLDCEDMEVDLNIPKFTKYKIDKSVEYFYSNDEIEKILADYIDSIRKTFVKFRNTYLQDKPIKLIFLTGGASRMDFVQQIVREVFDYKDDFYKDINPSLTISNGIALAGRADLRTYSMEQNLLSSDVIQKADIATRTIKETSSIMAEQVIKKASECYSSFASRSYDDNLESLETEIKNGINSICASSSLILSYNSVLKDVANRQIIPQINNIVKDYFPDFEIECIKSSAGFSLSVKSDNISTISSVISSSLDKIEEGLIEGVAKLIWNIGVGGIAFVEGVAVNAAISVVNLFREKPIDYVDVEDTVDSVTFSFRDKKTKLSSSRRNDVKKAFDEHKSTYKNSICSDIESALNKESSLKDQINTKGRDEIKKYIKEQIQKARIMLN